VFEKLIAGNCIGYAFNYEDTISVTPEMISEEDVVWLPTQHDVEIAISKRLIERPIVAVNGIVQWIWPEPVPRSLTMMDF
jgi:hypothetical protein